MPGASFEAPSGPQNIPATPLPDATPAFIEDCRYEVYMAIGICLPIMVISTCIRVYVKARILKKTSRDDYMIVAALLSALALGGVLLGLGRLAMYGKHVYQQKEEEVSITGLRLAVAVGPLYHPPLFLVKTAVALFYLEVFGPLRWLRYSAYGGIVFFALFHGATLVANAVLSAPRNGGSNKRDYTSTAYLSIWPLLMAQSAISIVCDLYLFVLPIPALWSLQMLVH